MGYDSNERHLCYMCSEVIDADEPKIVVGIEGGHIDTMHPRCYVAGSPYTDLWFKLLALLHDEELLRLTKRISVLKPETVGWGRLSDALFTEVQIRDLAKEVESRPLPYERST